MLELSGPITVSLEVTSYCNGKCSGCSNVFSPQKEELTPAQWKIILDKLAPYVEEYRITGGEPSLRPDLFAILKLLDEHKKYYHIFTNASWQDPDAWLAQCKNLAYLSSFLISLHGDTAAGHASFSNNDDFDTLVANIRRAISAGFEVNTNTVLTRKNFQHIPEIVNFVSGLGVKNAIFARYIGSQEAELLLSPEELAGTLQTLVELQNQGYNCSIGNCIPHCFFPAASSGCMAGITYATLDPWGNLRPCNHSPTLCGNLLHQEVTAVWQSQPLRAWRNRLPKGCKSCKTIALCPGGCKAEAELLKLRQDPLIGSPVKTLPQDILDVSLEDNLCPMLNCKVRTEPFGVILIRQTQVIPLTHKGAKILNLLDGKTSLFEIEKQQGAAALSFIYSLYLRNFLEFKPPSP